MQESCVEECSQENVSEVQRPIVKRLWINGKAGEDRDEWAKEVKAHSERCCDDKDKTSQMREERIQEPRPRGDCLEAWLEGRLRSLSSEYSGIVGR